MVLKIRALCSRVTKYASPFSFIFLPQIYKQTEKTKASKRNTYTLQEFRQEREKKITTSYFCGHTAMWERHD